MFGKLHCYKVVQKVNETSTIFRNNNCPIMQTYSTNHVVNVYTCVEYVNVLASTLN